MDMVHILHDFIRAEREGYWLSHLSSVARMAPYFFAMDRCNYARCLPVYLVDMHQLPQKHPAVFEQFMNGEHTVTRSSQPFSQVWSDMALEQSINLDSKKKGGITGITQKPGALDRWSLTSHERAAITSATKTMCGLEGGERVGSHKEASRQRITRDESDVQELTAVVVNGIVTNQFDLKQTDQGECIPLTNLASGLVMPNDMAIRLLASRDIGLQHMTTFIEERLNTSTKSFWDPLPQLKINTFTKMSIKKLKGADTTITVKADRDLVGRLVVVAGTRQVKLKKLMSYELATVPLALFHIDGTPRRVSKSTLLHITKRNRHDCTPHRWDGHCTEGEDLE